MEKVGAGHGGGGAQEGPLGAGPVVSERLMEGPAQEWDEGRMRGSQEAGLMQGPRPRM